MGQFGTIVLLGLALAIQPWSVLASIVLAAARRGTVKALSFLIGWALIIATIGYAGVLLADVAPPAATSDTALHSADLVVGLILAGLLTWRWRRGPPPPNAKSSPKWMAHVDTMRPIVALALGAFLPTYLFVVAAISQLLQADLTTGQRLLGMTGFVILASLGVASPLILMVVAPERAARFTPQARTWLIGHTRDVMYALGGLIAALLIIKGIVELLR